MDMAFCRRCTSPVEVLKLSKDDFDACFASGTPMAGSGADRVGPTADGGRAIVRSFSGAEAELRAKLISFIRMVSHQEHRPACKCSPWRSTLFQHR